MIWIINRRSWCEMPLCLERLIAKTFLFDIRPTHPPTHLPNCSVRFLFNHSNSDPNRAYTKHKSQPNNGYKPWKYAINADVYCWLLLLHIYLNAWSLFPAVVEWILFVFELHINKVWKALSMLSNDLWMTKLYLWTFSNVGEWRYSSKNFLFVIPKVNFRL